MNAMAHEKIEVHCIGETYNGDNVIYDRSWVPIRDIGYEHFRLVPLNK
jgi:hypothetical protein